MPSNDPPEGTRTTETKPQGRAGKTNCTNVHKANLVSQLSIFYMGSFTQARPRLNELTRTPSNDPPEQFYMGAHTTQTKPQGRERKMSYMNVHKANLRSNLAFLIWACPQLNDAPKQVDTNALKRPTLK